jgi:hypothetical protein
MSNSAFSQLDFRKWFDRMQPQTIAIASWLLYLDGLFSLLNYLDYRDIYGAWRANGGPISFLALFFVLAFPVGAFLMANGKRLGWYISLVAAFSPFILRAMWKLFSNDVLLSIDFLASQWTIRDIIFGTSFISFMFEAVLPALLLHTMSRNYVKIWLR